MESTRGLNNIPASEKGVNFGKPRPAAFGFQNGYQGDGVNDYFEAAGVDLENGRYQTYEFWVNIPATITTNSAIVGFYTPIGQHVSIHINTNKNLVCNTFGRSITASMLANGKNHVVITSTFGTTELPYSGWIMFVNGVRVSANTNNLNSNDFTNYNRVTIGRNQSVPSSIVLFDEFRYYDRILTLDEIRLLYNSGYGNNPINLQNLMLWYRFNEFISTNKMQDFSGSNFDLTGYNMDTNPSSPNYVLKPF